MNGGHGAAGTVDAEMGASGDGHGGSFPKKKSPASGWALEVFGIRIEEMGIIIGKDQRS
jgi:hypothetical protein